MFIRVMHSPAVRVLKALVGGALFVRGGLEASAIGVTLLAIGSLLMISAGSDVCLIDVVSHERPA